jgi:hypothetical protein
MSSSSNNTDSNTLENMNSNSTSLDIVETENDDFKENYDKIMEKIKKKKLVEYEPTSIEINKIYDILLKFIEEKKRKVYGGYALDKLFTKKNKDFALYDEFDTPDIDFYSPEPLEDLVEISNRLYEAGLKDVIGQEAQHKETYSIFVNHNGPYCDISYMPNNIYSCVRYIQIDNLNIVHPYFIMIDYFRMFTDPIFSYWRLEKHYERYKKLQQLYPLPLITKPLQLAPYKDNEISNTMNLVFDFLAQKTTTIFTGFYTYNYYLYVSEYHKKNKSYDYVFMPYLEVYSSDYVADGIELLEYIKTLPVAIKSKLSHVENYPFFQFYGYNMVLYYDDGKIKIPILYLYSNNKKCLPYKEVEYIRFDNNEKKPIKDKIMSLKIASFNLNILHTLIILIKIRVDKDDEWVDTLYKLLNGYVAFRNYYFKKNKSNTYSDTIFEGFVVDCIGETVDPERETRLIRKSRRKMGKPIMFRYEPETEKKSDKKSEEKKAIKYVFLNSSGNSIKKESNLKLYEKNKHKRIEEELDDEVNSDDS